ncbi:MAG: Arginine biosynthesis bifunctional protein ArgJ [Lentisphaerae bacterium ADurb.BinA184]|nr:MAG: Arginine biosynthesis bifunctional protein ArgJ [Lentisphaerae bacterium ADurb.BinA184]
MACEWVEDGGVTTPAGFRAAGVVAGFKRSGRKDAMLLVSDRPAAVAAAFTSNRYAAAPVQYDREIVGQGRPVRAVFVNSGNANACTGAQGLANARQMAALAADALGVLPAEVLVSSTGRIGVPLPMEKIRRAVELAVPALSPDGGHDAAEAIMTTDTRPKTAAVSFTVNGRTVTLGGTCKGAGMIAPKLIPCRPCQATMLAYLTTDAAVEPAFLQACLETSLDLSFNRITVDGDSSTNDTFLALANGQAGNRPLTDEHPDAPAFRDAFTTLAGRLAREMVLDGEGVTRFVELCVTGARDNAQARRCAEAIANSLLCKTAWFGADPNWGRILCAAGYSGVETDPARTRLDYDGVPIVRDGMDAGTPEKDQVAAISKREFRIALDLGVGDGTFTVWTCDLTYDYVKINADYHT